MLLAKYESISYLYLYKFTLTNCIMKNKINTSDKSIENAGIPTDYRDAVAELIWNGFDAKASVVDIMFNTNELGHVSKVTISDNGHGIYVSTR